MITPGEKGLASDFIDASSGAADEGKVPKLNANGKIASGFFAEVYQSTTSSLSVDTKAGQTLIVMAKGNCVAGVTIYLKNNSVTKDEEYVYVNAGGVAGNYKVMFTEVPGVQTNVITIDNGSTNYKIIAIVLG
jgi:hypothetical protein